MGLIDSLLNIIKVEEAQKRLKVIDDQTDGLENNNENFGGGPVDVGKDPSPYQIGGPVIIDDAGEGKELN